MEQHTRYRNHFIKIWQDECAQDSREWSDHLGVMAFFHKRYSLGDHPEELRESDFSSWDEMKSYIERKLKGRLITPVYMFDHSGIALAVDPERFHQVDSHGWDWGRIGFIYTTSERIREWYGKKLISQKTLNKAAKMLLHEVEEYDQYLTGDVYGYTIFDKDGNEIDSCGNYYGDKYIMHDAKVVVDVAVDGPRNGNRSYDKQQKAKSQLRDAKGRFIKKVA